MKQGMEESHEKGVANHSAPSFALRTVRCVTKRKQGYRWAGYRASKRCNQDADAFALAEGNMGGSDIASSCSVLRSRRPQTRLEASCTRTGRPRRRLLPTSSRTAGEGLGRKARMNVPEESDSGILPMNHSNKIEQSMAESEEGRPLIKEIEVGFHITMLICGVTLALSFVRLAPHSGGRMDVSEQKPVQTAE
jgi:hypothetical protein